MEQFDSQTVYLAVAVALAFLAIKYFMPRLVAGVPFVDVGILRSSLEGDANTVVVDVRTPPEYSGSLGHVPGAVNVPLNELPARLRNKPDDWDALKEAPIFVMCQTANRSPTGARLLKKAGFTKVFVVKGGMRAWKRSGFPTE